MHLVTSGIQNWDTDSQGTLELCRFGWYMPCGHLFKASQCCLVFGTLDLAKPSTQILSSKQTPPSPQGPNILLQRAIRIPVPHI
mmetsp:Transcript_74893/g.92028  ORF Transcript_74893/g.92028 Transcript_74893/m.92028 type:complete len:84 (+) Transcript_74893:460-711(+)